MGLKRLGGGGVDTQTALNTTALAEITGQLQNPSATHAGLPTTDANGDAANEGDYSVLTQDDIGTGTAQNPQYPAGFYRFEGGAYVFKFTTGSAHVADAGAISGTVDGDALLSTLQVGQAYHFQAAFGDVSLTSATEIGFAIDGDLQAQGSVGPLTIPIGTQGFITKNVSGDLTVYYNAETSFACVSQTVTTPASQWSTSPGGVIGGGANFTFGAAGATGGSASYDVELGAGRSNTRHIFNYDVAKNTAGGDELSFRVEIVQFGSVIASDEFVVSDTAESRTLEFFPTANYSLNITDTSVSGANRDAAVSNMSVAATCQAAPSVVDTSGTVEIATGDFTSTNGVSVRAGDQYQSNPDGTTLKIPGVCEINEFIHNIADYHLAIAHEAAGGTFMSITVNGAAATYDNLLNATDNADGSVTFGSGANSNFNRLASTVESIREVGEVFEITKPTTGQFDTQIVSITKSPDIAANLQGDTYRLRFNGTQCDILDPTGAVVATATPENGVYRITRTFTGFDFVRNGADFFKAEVTECIDYNSGPQATTHVFDGLTVDAAPPWVGNQSIANNATEVIPTGVDLNDVEQIRVTFGRNNNSWGKIVVSFDPSEIDFDVTQGMLLPHFGNTFLSINNMTAADFAAGDMPFAASTGAAWGFEVSRIEFKKRAVGVSRRLGEMVHMKAARFTDDAAAVAEGYLPVKPGTVTNGAVDYPLWATIYSEFVTGDDIVFPADVDGMFLRNIGGNADLEGVFQGDENKAHTHSYTDTSHPNFRDEGNGSTIVRQGSVNTPKTTGSEGGVEARPINRAYQLYTIVDSYVEIQASGVAPVADTSASGYQDIPGTSLRMQWGTAPNDDGPATINFPAPFADTTYSFNGTFVDDGTGNRSGPAADVGLNWWASNKTVNSIDWDRDDDIDGLDLMWKAIGLKP